MAKRKRHQSPDRAAAGKPAVEVPVPKGRLPGILWLGATLLLGLGAGAVIWQRTRSDVRPPDTPRLAPQADTALTATAPVVASSPATQGAGAAAGTPTQPGTAPTNAFAQEPGVMEINKAVMVTVELDFGPSVPSIAEALQQIERRHKPEDGVGRTFAILDAYGGPTPDGKKLHLSMHVSTEKPGWGALVFKRTGEVLWQSRIVQGTNTTRFTGQNLLILLDDGTGRLFTVDGSNNPATILDARLKELGLLVSDFWPNGAEREVTFLYSACGCPVKVRVRRLNDRTERVSDQPVIFPDDPAVVRLITRLMGW